MLFPAPRSISRLTGAAVAASAAVVARPVSGLAPQGYRLRLEGDAIDLGYADEAGRRYGEATLAQLRAAHPTGIPAQSIEDWPDFPVRGLMLDISRDRVPTRQTLERLVELMALCRINHFELYTEHTFAYRDHAAVWRDASPITAEDLEWLDQLCAERGIELSANQNCFGHMERWLRHPEYRERAECPAGWVSKLGGTMPPAVLAPSAANAELALALIRELASHLRSRRVNIGCDETFELGKGASAAAVEQHGRARVYFDHLLRLIEPLRSDGFEVMFWGDILRSHPELVAELPRDRLIALVWHYEAPIDPEAMPPVLLQIGAEFGITSDALRGFAGQIDSFAGVPHWVCPGTSSWNSFVGRLANAKANMLDAATHGLRSGARGYMITDWGDNGHLQPPSISFAPLAYGAAISWCLDSNRDLPVAQVIDRYIFQDRAGELGAAIESIGDVYAHTGKVGFNGSPLFTAVVRRGVLGALGVADAGAVEQVLSTLAQASARVARSQPQCHDRAVVRRELQQAIALARHGAWQLARECGAPAPSEAELQQDLARLIEEQRQCWLLRSRPGGLEDSLARLRP